MASEALFARFVILTEAHNAMLGLAACSCIQNFPISAVLVLLHFRGTRANPRP